MKEETQKNWLSYLQNQQNPLQYQQECLQLQDPTSLMNQSVQAEVKKDLK